MGGGRACGDIGGGGAGGDEKQLMARTGARHAQPRLAALLPGPRAPRRRCPRAAPRRAPAPCSPRCGRLPGGEQGTRAARTGMAGHGRSGTGYVSWARLAGRAAWPRRPPTASSPACLPGKRAQEPVLVLAVDFSAPKCAGCGGVFLGTQWCPAARPKVFLGFSRAARPSPCREWSAKGAS